MVLTLEGMMTKRELARSKPVKTIAYDTSLPSPDLPADFRHDTAVWMSADQPGIQFGVQTLTCDSFFKVGERQSEQRRQPPTIFLINDGWTTRTHAEWVVAEFRATVYFVEIGMHRSSTATGQQLTWMKLAEAVIEFMDSSSSGSGGSNSSEGAESLASSGCGPCDCAMGFCGMGEVLGRVAAARPDLVKSVILTGTPATPLGEDMFAGMSSVGQLFAMPDGQGLGMMADCMMMNVSGTFARSADGRRVRDTVEQMMRRWYEEVGPEADVLSPILNSNYWGHWHTITQPVLAISGSDDAAFLAGIEHLVAIVPNATSETLAGVMHAPQVECPREYLRTVSSFLSRQLGTRPRGQLEAACRRNSASSEAIDLVCGAYGASPTSKVAIAKAGYSLRD
jgi:hypothetical protein